MNRQLILERLKKVIVEQLEVDPNYVTPEANFANDLNADELAWVELVMAVEEEFEIEIPDDVTEHITTVQQAVDYLFGRFSKLDLKELQALIESIADFWVKVEICEEEAIDLTRKAFNVIKDRNIASKRRELSELKAKFRAAKAEVESIEARIKQCEKDIE